MDTYSNRSNAKRAAEKMIAAGDAPAVDYGFRTDDNGRIEIAWKNGAEPALVAPETLEPTKRTRKRQPAPAKPATRGKAADAQAAAEAGKLPTPPDFTAETHKPYRKRLAALVALAEAGDLAGLEAVEMLPPRSTSPKALQRYRDLAIVALRAQPGR